MNPDATYIGNELELFDHAHNWKNYWGEQVKPFLGERVLEVGAGIGGTTKQLVGYSTVQTWVCLEPDPRLSQQILPTLSHVPGIKNKVQVLTRFLADYKTEEKFDSVLYIDVIEHIEHDAPELQLASSFLKPGGVLIVIVPAHNALFSEFDKAIGHFRRYNKAMLRKAKPASLQTLKLNYLDTVGLLASFANKLFLKQKYPTLKQIKFWDSTLVPISKVIDKFLGYSLGKSVLLIARKK